jgi:hypothetical protein
VTKQRNRRQGLLHRNKLRALVLPRLLPGAVLPSARQLGWMLRINASEGYRHMRRVLAEEGIATETRGSGKGRRIYVVSLQVWRNAA